MQEQHEWDACYDQKETPWDTGRPDGALVRLLSDWPCWSGRVLEIGCGTGSNALWLTQQGFEVTALDISTSAIAIARQRSAEQGMPCSFDSGDFLKHPLPERHFTLAFDRGCFHSMATDARRAAFSERVAGALQPAGLWFSLIGNSDQHSEGKGPPRLSAVQIAAAAEPHFEILRLESCLFDGHHHAPLRFWQCLMRVRSH